MPQILSVVFVRSSSRQTLCGLVCSHCLLSVLMVTVVISLFIVYVFLLLHLFSFVMPFLLFLQVPSKMLSGSVYHFFCIFSLDMCSFFYFFRALQRCCVAQCACTISAQRDLSIVSQLDAEVHSSLVSFLLFSSAFFSLLLFLFCSSLCVSFFLYPLSSGPFKDAVWLSVPALLALQRDLSIVSQLDAQGQRVSVIDTQEMNKLKEQVQKLQEQLTEESGKVSSFLSWFLSR